jgi:hypothetical protein
VRHDALVEQIVAEHEGQVVRPRGEGDSHFAVFNSPSDALFAAGALHSQLDRTSRTDSIDLRVRVGVHLGEARATGNDYYGLAVNQTARLRSVAHGGQTVLSRAAAAIAEPTLAPGVRLRSLGYHRLRDFPRLEEVFQAAAVGARDSFPPLQTGATRSPAVLAVVRPWTSVVRVPQRRAQARASRCDCAALDGPRFCAKSSPALVRGAETARRWLHGRIRRPARRARCQGDRRCSREDGPANRAGMDAGRIKSSTAK